MNDPKFPKPSCETCGEPTSYTLEVAEDGPLEGLLVAICDDCGREWE